MSCCNQRLWFAMLRTSSATSIATSPAVAIKQRHANLIDLANMVVGFLMGESESARFVWTPFQIVPGDEDILDVDQSSR